MIVALESECHSYEEPLCHYARLSQMQEQVGKLFWSTGSGVMASQEFSAKAQTTIDGPPTQQLGPVEYNIVWQIFFYKCNFILRLTCHGAVDGQVARCEAVERGTGHVIPGVHAAVNALLWSRGVGAIDPGVAVGSYSLTTTALHRT